MIYQSRRRLLRGIFSAPAIIAIDHMMPVKALMPEPIVQSWAKLHSFPAFQDVAGMIPALLDGDPVALARMGDITMTQAVESLRPTLRIGPQGHYMEFVSSSSVAFSPINQRI